MSNNVRLFFDRLASPATTAALWDTPVERSSTAQSVDAFVRFFYSHLLDRCSYPSARASGYTISQTAPVVPKSAAAEEPALSLPAARPESVKPAAIIKPSPELTMTAYLRFVNIWLHIERLGLTGAGKTVSIFGAGKLAIDDQVHCPQLAEACKMFDGSTITVYDNNSEVLEATRHVNHRVAQKWIQDVFDCQWNQELVQSDNFSKIRAQLESEREPNCRVTQRHFCMGKDQLDAGGDYDVILATYSLLYPMKELLENDRTGNRRMDLFSQYLSQLKPGGAMYVDRPCILALVGDSKLVQKYFAKDAMATETFKQMFASVQWLRRLEQTLSARGINVEIHELHQAFGMKVLFSVARRRGPTERSEGGSIWFFLNF